jgi:predicted site-specific integrase-resolvase
MSSDADATTIAQAGIRLGQSYNAILRRVLVGELKGWQDERGRWRILEADVSRLEGSRPAARAAAG